MLKKILMGLLIAVVLVFVFHSFIIGVIVKPQVEAQASKILGTEVKIGVLSVRLWPGNAAVYGFEIKNPTGFSNEQLLDLGSLNVSLDVPGLIKQFTSSGTATKTVVIDHVKIKGLKFLFERVNQGSKPFSNVDKLVENLNANQPAVKAETPATEPAKSEEPKKPMDIRVELKHFSFKDGRVTVKDATVGNGFEYVLDDINIDFQNIFFPAKPASELVEIIDFSAELGKQNPGELKLKGRSNLMAGANIDAQLQVKALSLVDFNVFVVQPFQIEAGTFDLASSIKILSNQLTSQHKAQINSVKLIPRASGSSLVDLPMQTFIAAANRLPSLDVDFEVNGDLKNPQFNFIQTARAAMMAAIQKVLAGGLGDLKGLANNLQGQALDMAGSSTGKVTNEATKLVQGITGESTESIDAGIKKLSGLLGKVTKSE